MSCVGSDEPDAPDEEKQVTVHQQSLPELPLVIGALEVLVLVVIVYA